MCMQELLCSSISPGAIDSQSVWLDKTGAITLPASQVVTVDYYKRDFEYENGDMAVSEHDMRTYKCIDTNVPANGCWNDAPFANSLWQMITFKPPIDDSWVVYNDFIELYRYILNDYITKIDSNQVYICFDETYCQLDPLAPMGEKGWGLTQYASPNLVDLYTPKFRYFVGSHQWLKGDIAIADDGKYYECNVAPDCRNAEIGEVLTFLLEWISWVLPQGGVMENIEEADLSVVMPW